MTIPTDNCELITDNFLTNGIMNKSLYHYK